MATAVSDSSYFKIAGIQTKHLSSVLGAVCCAHLELKTEK